MAREVVISVLPKACYKLLCPCTLVPGGLKKTLGRRVHNVVTKK